MDAKNKLTVYAFIDSQNLNLSVRNDIYRHGIKIYSGWKLDFRRFYVYLKDKYKVEKAYLFIGRVDGYESLYRFLEDVGYKVIYKPTLDYSDGHERFTKGNVDAELVLHTMVEYPNFDKALIVSSDGDYYCLVEHLEKNNKLGHVVIPNKHNYSSLLKRYSRYFVYVSDLKEKLELRKQKERD